MTILLQRISEGEEETASSGFGAVESEFGNLPLRQLSYHADMLGLAVRTTILQTYYNPFDEAIEATYIFPLEYGHAVVACEMRIGERVVQAELKERAEARREYTKAIRNGHRAALLEENRPETFSMRVGNIPPGEAIQICIQTVSQLSVVQGEWTLRLPLVVAPRYTSGLPLPRPACGSGTCSDTNQVPDASTVTPPTWLPGFASPIDLRLVVDMDIGQLTCSDDWMQQLKSSLHTTLVDHKLSDTDTKDMHRCRVQMLPGERVNRDFILRGRVLDTQTSSSVVCEKDEIGKPNSSGKAPFTTFAVTIVPPRATSVVPRQLVYLLDRSGSMEGWKIAAARRGLCRLIDRLGNQDVFQLATFESRLDVFQAKAKRGAWIAGTDENRFEAVRWLSNIDARGGTEMGQAIEFALRAFSPNLQPVKNHNGAIVLVTDGQITGEDALLRLIDSLPRAQVPRLFCLGVDRAVNASVLERISQHTGGTFELVESEERMNEVLERFANEVANPALTQMSISCQSGEALNIAQPNNTTLYAGRSRTIYGRYAGTSPLTLTVHGLTANFERYKEQLPVLTEAKHAETKPARPGLLRALWGKERLRSLEDDLFASGTNDHKLKKEIIDCSLDCGVLSRLTAFVAVDRTEKVTDGRQPHPILNPSELPEGWTATCPQLDASMLLRVPRKYNAGQTQFPSLQAIAEQAARKMLEAGAISNDQLVEAQTHALTRGLDVCGSLVELQYATHASVAQGIAAATQTTYIPVSHLKIDESVIQCLPESIARESHVLAIANSTNALTVVMANPLDLETIEKLRFILNRNIIAFCGAYDEIADAINHHYGHVVCKSADSMLQEFTDTQFDFTEAGDIDMDCFADGFADSSPSRIVNLLSTIRSRRAKLSSSAASRGRVPEFRLQKMETHLHARSENPVTPEIGDKFSEGQVMGAFREADSENGRALRGMIAILFEAADMKASHIIARIEGEVVQFEFIIDGSLVQRDRAPVQLWWPIVNKLKEFAGLDTDVRDSIQTGTLAVQSSRLPEDIVLHVASETFLIEFTPAKQLPPVPEAIEKWWAAAGVTAQP